MTVHISRRVLASVCFGVAALVAALALRDPGPGSSSGVSAVPLFQGGAAQEGTEVGGVRMALESVPGAANPALELESEGTGLSVRCIDAQGAPIEAKVSVFRGAKTEARPIQTVDGLATIVLQDWTGCLLNAKSDSGAFGTLKVVGSMVQEASATIVLREPAVLAGRVLLPARSLESGGRISAQRVNPPFRDSLADTLLSPPDHRPEGVWATADIEPDGSFRIVGLEHGGVYRLCVDAPGILAAQPNNAYKAPDEQLLIRTEFLYAGTLELVEEEGSPPSIVIDNGATGLSVIGGNQGFKGPFLVDLLQWTHSASYASAPAAEKNKETLWFSSESDVPSADIAIEVKCMGFPKVKASLRIEPCDGRPCPTTRVRYGTNPVRGTISLVLRPAVESVVAAPDPKLSDLTYDGALLLANLANPEDAFEILVRFTPHRAHLIEGVPVGEYACRLRGRRGAPSLPLNAREWTNLVVSPGVNELAFEMPPTGQVEIIVELPEDQQEPALGRRLWEGPMTLEWLPLDRIRYVEDGKISGSPYENMALLGPPFLIPAIAPGSYVMRARNPPCFGNLVHALDGSMTDYWTLEVVADTRNLVRTQMQSLAR